MVASAIAMENSKDGYISIVILTSSSIHLIEGKNYLVDINIVKAISVDTFAAFNPRNSNYQ